MRQLIFEDEAFDEFIEWITINKKLFDRIVKLLNEVRRQPFEGTGKPEPLKHDYKGY
jgi:toxin YoeB